MQIEALKINKWCDANLSEVAWQRIVVKVSPEFRGSGLNIKNLSNPDGTIQLTDQQYGIIKKAIEETYAMELTVQA